MDSALWTYALAGTLALAALLAFAHAALVRAGRVRAGGLYAVPDGAGGFRVLKVLAVEPARVHIRLYPDTFPTLPVGLEPSRLGRPGPGPSPDRPGVAHLPLAREEFSGWRPVYLGRARIERDELDGYESWRKARAVVARSG